MTLSLQKQEQGHWERAFKANVSEIASAASWIESIAASAGFADTQAFSMQVCLEELMSNIVRHGKERSGSQSSWPSGSGHLRIAIAIDADADRITMTIEDNARPFDLGKAVAKKIDQPLDQLEPGGLGIHLIKSFSSAMEYQRTEHGNRVTVEFKG
jgi:anti-sigma regulatory factor (Ser/Thr protein kinase)